MQVALIIYVRVAELVQALALEASFYLQVQVLSRTPDVLVTEFWHMYCVECAGFAGSTPVEDTIMQDW